MQVIRFRHFWKTGRMSSKKIASAPVRNAGAFKSSIDGIPGGRGVNFDVFISEDDETKESLTFKLSASEARQLAAELVENAERAEKM